MEKIYLISHREIWKQEHQINRAYYIFYEFDLIDRNAKITKEEGRDIIANKKKLCIVMIDGER